MSVEFVGIQLDLIGEEAVQRDLEEIDALLRSLGGRKKVKSGMADLARDTAKARGELEKYERLRQKYVEAGGDGDAYVKEIAEAKYRLKDLQQAQREVTASTKNLGKTFKQQFQSIQSSVAHVGSAMQSFGNALTRLSSPFTRLTSGLVMGAGFKALNMMTEGFSNAFTRADVLNKYTKLMAEYETANYSAIQSRTDLDESIQGLPIALDDAISLAQRYTLSLGDMERGTQLAIATNNAFLASMATEQQRYQGMLQMQDLLNGKKLNSREWMSLGASMGKAINEIGKEFGYTDENMGLFRQELYSGKIATKDFLDALQKVGTGKGSLVALARVSAETWEGLGSNIRIAFSRMGADVIKTLNETFADATGRSLLQTLLGWDAEGNDLKDGIKSWINGISQSMQNWIKANPDRILEFFNALKSIDWKGLLKGMAEGIGIMARAVEWLAKKLEDTDLSKLGKSLMWSGIVGRGLTVLGGVIKGLRGPIAGFLTVVARGGSKLFKGQGLFGKLASFFGKKKAIEQASQAGQAITTASPKLVSAFKNMALLSGIVAMPAVTGFVVTGAVKQTVKNFKDIIGLLKDMDWKAATKVAAGIGAFIGGSAILGGLVGKFGVTAGTFAIIGETIVGLIATIGTGFADLNMALIKGSIKKFVDSINLLKDIPDVSTFGDVKAKISNAITMMNEISSLFNGEWTGPGMHEGGVANIGLGAVWGINTLAKALEPMKTAIQRINEIASLSISEGAVDSIRRTIKAISDIQAEMWVLMGIGFGNIKNNMKKVADAMYEMRRIVYHINKLGGEKINEKALEGITESIKAIGDAFDATAIGEIRVKITGFVASINDALTEFDKINDVKINAKVTLARSFYTSVDSVVRDIKTARKNIRNAWNDIPTDLSKTITFTLKAKVVAENLYAGASKARSIAEDALNSVRRANGGLIYRAKGGGVPWKRRGTDTVPAMLTPGEYVHNKRAVNTFGIDFMRKVNNLDVKGAMNELMHRAGNMANVNRGAVVTNNYNNQRVTINNNGNPGAGFTFKSASRFVGAI